jgi:hypothetical protein
VSCHDPHNKTRRIDNLGTQSKEGKPIINSGSAGIGATEDAPVGVYRLLGSSGYDAGDGHSFVYPSPDAISVMDGHGLVYASYGKGMSEWCSNCHPNFLQPLYVSGVSGQMHPAGNGAHLTPEIAKNYNAYVKSGDMSGASGHWSLVPVEEGTSVYDQLRMQVSLAMAGNKLVTTAANVMCVTCHRAHASPWRCAIRWPYGEDAKPSSQGFNNNHAVFTGLGGYQRSLCNKCHAKD